MATLSTPNHGRNSWKIKPGSSNTRASNAARVSLRCNMNCTKFCGCASACLDAAAPAVIGSTPYPNSCTRAITVAADTSPRTFRTAVAKLMSHAVTPARRDTPAAMVCAQSAQVMPSMRNRCSCSGLVMGLVDGSYRYAIDKTTRRSALIPEANSFGLLPGRRRWRAGDGCGPCAQLRRARPCRHRVDECKLVRIELPRVCVYSRSR